MICGVNSKGLFFRVKAYKMNHYFAYGSNLHPVRLLDRVSSARLMGVVQLDGYQLAFHKRSDDGSGKCNLLKTRNSLDTVHGAIYEIEPEHRSVLDEFEGNGYGYTDNQIQIQYLDKEYNCFTYLAQQSLITSNLKPYHWYKEMVVLGAKYLKFPDTYVSTIESVESCDDPDNKRSSENYDVLKKIKNYC